MEAVCDLNSIWRPLPRTFGKRARPVTRDDLDTGMILQPTGQGRRTRIGKHLERSIGAKVNQDSFEVQALAIGPFVHAKDCGRCSFR